jgi:hypothetical protein
MKKTLIVLLVILGMAGPVFAQRFHHYFLSNYEPMPRLISPVGETVDLTGKNTLEFVWSPFEGSIAYRHYFDFRLYKGYQTYESTLIFKEQVPRNKYGIVLDAGIFEDGQIYTWTLRGDYVSGKSQRAYNSFKVIKK